MSGSGTRSAVVVPGEVSCAGSTTVVHSRELELVVLHVLNGDVPNSRRFDAVRQLAGPR